MKAVASWVTADPTAQAEAVRQEVIKKLAADYQRRPEYFQGRIQVVSSGGCSALEGDDFAVDAILEFVAAIIHVTQQHGVSEITSTLYDASSVEEVMFRRIIQLETQVAQLGEPAVSRR